MAQGNGDRVHVIKLARNIMRMVFKAFEKPQNVDLIAKPPMQFLRGHIKLLKQVMKPPHYLIQFSYKKISNIALSNQFSNLRNQLSLDRIRVKFDSQAIR